MRIGLVVVVVLFGLGSPANALQDYPAKFILFACRSHDEKLQLSCETYISGAQAMAQMLYAKGLSTLRLCLPDNAPLAGVTSAWSAYLTKHPELIDKPAILSLANAIHQNFPCP